MLILYIYIYTLLQVWHKFSYILNNDNRATKCFHLCNFHVKDFY